MGAKNSDLAFLFFFFVGFVFELKFEKFEENVPNQTSPWPAVPTLVRQVMRLLMYYYHPHSHNMPTRDQNARVRKHIQNKQNQILQWYIYKNEWFISKTRSYIRIIQTRALQLRFFACPIMVTIENLNEQLYWWMKPVKIIFYWLIKVQKLNWFAIPNLIFPNQTWKTETY